MKVGPFSGRKKKPLFRVKFDLGAIPKPAHQAVGGWRWANFLESLAPPGKRILRVNMDETSIHLWQESGPGFVDVPAATKKKVYLEREKLASLALRRGTCSLLVFVSDDDEAQRLLPQVLVVNKHTVTAQQTRAVQAELGLDSQCFLWRRDSAWCTAKAFCSVVKLLAKCLEPLKPLAHCLFAVDCAPSHATKEVAATAARCGIFLHMIPSSMTSSLQPLDVYVFAKFKRRLRTLYEEKALASSDGCVARDDVLRLVFTTVAEVVQGKSWTRAFRGCGWGAAQQCIGEHLQRKLAWKPEQIAVGSEMPGLSDLQAVWPGRKEIPIALLFHLPKKIGIEGSDLEPVLELTDADRPAPNPWIGRLRSFGSAAASSSQALPSVPEAASPPCLVPATLLTPSPTPLSMSEPSLPSWSLPPISLTTPAPRLPVGRPLFRRMARTPEPSPTKSPT